jgi:hypothetical protein
VEPSRTPEQNARAQIDALLDAAGWAVQDYRAFNPGASRGIALREVPLASGRCDYRDSPLEVMAYDLQARFDTEPAPFDAERLVRESLTP